MITDLHIHTEFSCDSEADMQEYLLNGIQKNVNAVFAVPEENVVGYTFYNSY